jgi:hypothetical protein
VFKTLVVVWIHVVIRRIVVYFFYGTNFSANFVSEGRIADKRREITRRLSKYLLALQ